MTKRNNLTIDNENKIIDAFHFYNDKKYPTPLYAPNSILAETLFIFVSTLILTLPLIVIFFYLKPDDFSQLLTGRITQPSVYVIVSIYIVFMALHVKRIIHPFFSLFVYFKEVMFQFNSDRLNFTGFLGRNYLSEQSFNYDDIKYVEFMFNDKQKSKRLSRSAILKRLKNNEEGLIRVHTRKKEVFNLSIIDSLYSQEEIIEIKEQFIKRGVKVLN